MSAVVDRLAHRGVTLGVLPLGTANDFARTLQIPMPPVTRSPTARSSTSTSVW